MKRIIGLLLALVMTVSLAACASTAPASPAAAEPAAAVEEAEAAAPEGELSPYEQAIADRRAEYEKTGVYPKVVFSFYDWTGAPEGTARVQEAMNKILREKLCLEVELLILDSAVYTQDVRLMLSSGEQVEPIVEERELIQAMRDFLRTLKPDARHLFMQRYFMAESVQTIAELNQMNENTVKSKLLRIRRKLQDYLRKEGLL